MTDQDFADLVVYLNRAERERDESPEKWQHWFDLSREHSAALRERQDRRWQALTGGDPYPAVQFTREPDEGLL